MNINNPTANINVTKLGAIPAFAVSPSRVTFHLTRGHIIEGDAEYFNDAINFIGTVQASTTPSEFKNWKFGFLQLQKINTLGIYYAGPTRKSGQIALLVHEGPAMPQTIHLDSEKNFAPWTHSFDATLSAGKITAISGDHPASRAPRKMTNSATNAFNYLFHVIDDRRFWTVLTAEDPAGNFHHLAHVAWKLRYDFQFAWRNGSPKLHKGASTFFVGDSVIGAPTDKGLQSLLKNPKSPYSNEEVRKALKYTVLHGEPNRHDWPVRQYSNLPREFYE